MIVLPEWFGVVREPQKLGICYQLLWVNGAIWAYNCYIGYIREVPYLFALGLDDSSNLWGCRSRTLCTFCIGSKIVRCAMCVHFACRHEVHILRKHIKSSRKLVRDVTGRSHSLSFIYSKMAMCSQMKDDAEKTTVSCTALCSTIIHWNVEFLQHANIPRLIKRCSNSASLLMHLFRHTYVALLHIATGY